MMIPTGKPDAQACVRGGGDAPALRGTVKFYAIPGGTLVTAEVRGLPENDTVFFAFHIHEGETAVGRIFQIREDILTPDIRSIPATRGICHRSCPEAAALFSRWKPTGLRPGKSSGGRW